MGIQEGLDFIYCGGLGVGFAATACGVAFWGGVGEAGGEDLLGVGVGGELLLCPLDGYFLGEAALGELVAHSHDVFVVAARGKLDVVLCQLRGYEGVVVGLNAAQLLVLLALLGVGGGLLGDFFHREGDGFGFGTEEDFGVVGKSAQSSNVLALRVCLDAKESLVVGVASEKSLLVKFIGILCKLILIDDTQAVAANGGVAHQCVRVGGDFLLQLLTYHDMVEIYEAQSCKSLDVLLPLAALEGAGDGEELALGLEGLATCLAVGGCECFELLIGADEVGYSFKQARKRELGGHVFENTNVHLL